VLFQIVSKMVHCPIHFVLAYHLVFCFIYFSVSLLYNYGDPYRVKITKYEIKTRNKNPE
jgi:hypothetical protein